VPEINARSNAGDNAAALEAPHPVIQRSEGMNRYGLLTSVLLAMQLVVLRQIFTL
jgi:hypothetical protein